MRTVLDGVLLDPLALLRVALRAGPVPHMRYGRRHPARGALPWGTTSRPLAQGVRPATPKGTLWYAGVLGG